MDQNTIKILDLPRSWGHQVAQSVERRTLEIEVRCSKPALCTWWWGRMSPNQPYPKGAAPAATTSLTKWGLHISLNGIKTVSKKKIINV